MKTIRRFILFLSLLIGIWVVVSGLGVVVDPGNSAFWSDSLMWSVLSCLLVLPAPLVANIGLLVDPDDGTHPHKQATEQSVQTSFVDDDVQVDTLWPETADTDWPYTADDEEEQHTHA